MSPPISKDWWLAAALSAASVPAAVGQVAPAPVGASRATGVVTTSVPGAPSRSAPLTFDGTREERITTDGSPKHVLLADQSALTIGPNSTVVLKRFQYDNEAKSGNLVVELTRGLLRVVGGQISKRNATLVATPTATVGIRGGISIVSVSEKGTDAAFLFGDSMEVRPTAGRAGAQSDIQEGGPARVAVVLEGAEGVETAQSSNPQPVVVTRAGFGVSIGPGGQTTRNQLSSTLLAGLLGSFNNPNPTPPSTTPPSTGGGGGGGGGSGGGGGGGNVNIPSVIVADGGNVPTGGGVTPQTIRDVVGS